MISFSLYLESRKTPWVYHITYLKNLGGIFSGGIVKRGGFSPWTTPNIHKNSDKGVFFSTNLTSAKRWMLILINQAIHRSQNAVQNGLIPIIIRFRHNINAWRKDDLGNVEAVKSYYTQKSINSLGIEVWDGHKWSKNLQDARYLVLDLTNDDLERDFENDRFDLYALPPR